MKLYHGSNVAVEHPQILQSDRGLDFGTGFYLTSSYEQAERWAYLTWKRRNSGRQTISTFDFDENAADELKVRRFSGATEEWLRFVADNRRKADFANDWDLVIGPVANDRTSPVLRLYFVGVYNEEEAIKRLLPQKLSDQYAFKTEEALEYLENSGVIEL